MKVVTPDTGFLIYQKVFKKLQSGGHAVVVWQVFPENGRRVVNTTKLNSFGVDTKMLYLEAVTEYVDSELPLYCYVEEGQFIFKGRVADVSDNYLQVSFPPELQLLEDEDITVIQSRIGSISTIWKSKRTPTGPTDETDVIRIKAMSERSSRDQDFLNGEFDSQMSLDEEEKLFENKRESKRMRPKVEKKVMVKSSLGESELFQLFDLSRGGMGFLSNNLEVFPKGSTIEVVGFDEFMLDDPLLGTVVAHRLLDDSQTDYKIGVKFNDGQS